MNAATENGFWHLCGMSVHVDGYGTALHQTKICAGGGLAQQLYEDACVDKCESDLSSVCPAGIRPESGNSSLFTCSPDCAFTTVSATSGDCRNASIVPGPPAIGQALVALGPTSTISVTIDDASSGNVTPAGMLYSSAAPAPEPGSKRWPGRAWPGIALPVTSAGPDQDAPGDVLATAKT